MNFLKRIFLKYKMRNLNLPDIPIDGSFIDYHNYSQDILKILKKNYGEIPFYTQISQNDPGKSMVFYRARKANEILNQNIISEYSFPPAVFCKKALRANLPFHPVFYATNNAMTAVFETFQNKNFEGQMLAVSRWIMKDTDPFFIAPFLFSNLSSNHPWATMVSDYKTKGLLDAGVSKEKIEQTAFLLEELTNIFYNDSDYKISASIAHNFLYSTQRDLNCDVFIYPSIQASGENVNFAVHPNFVINRLFIDKIYIIELGGFNPKTQSLNLRLHAIGKLSNNRLLLWQNGDFKADDYNDYKQYFNII